MTKKQQEKQAFYADTGLVEDCQEHIRCILAPYDLDANFKRIRNRGNASIRSIQVSATSYTPRDWQQWYLGTLDKIADLSASDLVKLLKAKQGAAQ